MATNNYVMLPVNKTVELPDHDEIWIAEQGGNGRTVNHGTRKESTGKKRYQNDV